MDFLDYKSAKNAFKIAGATKRNSGGKSSVSAGYKERDVATAQFSKKRNSGPINWLFG